MINKKKVSSDTEEDQTDAKSYITDNTGATTLMAEISTSKEVTSSITKEASVDHDTKIKLSSDTKKGQPVFTSDNTTILKDQLSTFPIKNITSGKMTSLKKIVSTSKGTETPVKIEMWRASLINIHDGLKQGDRKWSAIVLGLDGKFYGIPFNASRVFRFHPNDTTPMEQIGPDLGVGGAKWSDGIMAKSGVIYCIPFNSDKVLKIDTNVENNGNVTTIDIDLPEEGNAKWCSGATSKIDGYIYCMPESANRILKIKTTEDSFESVGVDLGNRIRKFRGAVADEDGFIYGIPEIFYDQLTLSPPDSVTNFH